MEEGAARQVRREGEARSETAGARPASRRMKRAPQGSVATVTGLFRLILVPSPTCPALLYPHPYLVLSLRIASAW